MLTVFVNAQSVDTIFRTNNGTQTASGTDLTTVQTVSGAATGDVITVSENTTVSTAIGDGTSSGYNANNFTLQAGSTPVTISGGTENNLLYNLPSDVTEFTLKNVTISGFTKNIAGGTGGTASVQGGAISFSGGTINADNVTFSNNKAAVKSGGAIYSADSISFSGADSVVTFTGNTALFFGGAIMSDNSISFSGAGSVETFTGNTVSFNGGAIYSMDSISFSGAGSVGTFTNNSARTNGNDLFLSGASSVLTFQDAGTYFFDGGIYLNNASASTVIDKAQVTIAGREFLPGSTTDADNTNIYQLRSVTISNGGTLTAELDNINSIQNTTITLNSAQSLVELNNALLNQIATIKSSTGSGNFIMDYLAAENGVFSKESLVISSGRIDAKGAMKAAVEVGSDATFSPGNSVGHVDIDGTFTLDTGTLLIEMDETGIDTMTATSFDLDNGTISFTLTDDIPWGASYDILTATGDGETFDNSIIDRILNGQTLPSYFSLALAGDSNIVRFSIDRNAVPEPSTWALLVLGAAGLLYVRKRTRK